MEQVKIQVVTVVGLGYIGLPTAAVLASRGIDVKGLEISDKVVETINQGKIHIVEPGLDVLVKLSVSSHKLKALKTPEPSDVFLIAVPTPFTDHHKPDMSYVKSAARSISEVLKSGDLVILESTSPVGTTELLIDWIKELRPDLFPSDKEKCGLLKFAYCPERVLPGQVLRELIENDRIIGGVNKESALRAQEFYKIFVQGECILTDARTAEMTKLSENSFRDINIAFANELSILCDRFGVDVWELIRLSNRHPRVNILQPGCGVGGHCIAVDPWFLVSAAPDQAQLIEKARNVNDNKKTWVVEKIKESITAFTNEKGRAPLVGCFGLSFKPNIDDLRESPAVDIFHDLKKSAVKVRAIEPNIDLHSEFDLMNLSSALSECDIIALLVKHREFLDLKYPEDKIILDFCGVMNDSSRR